MEFLSCKACGTEAVVPVELPPDAEFLGQIGDDADEVHFYSCQVCGDNWLSVKRAPLGGACEIEFVHQMGMHPTLRRSALLSNTVVMSEASVDHWSYYYGDAELDEKDWRGRLARRRGVLKAVCTN